MHIETTGKERGGRGSSARKRKEREKGQWEKECKIKRVKEGLYKQKKSQLHTGCREDREKNIGKQKSAKKKKKKAGLGVQEKKNNCLQSQRGRSERERRRRRRRERKKEDIWRKRERVEEEESVRARGD